jgi:hypothetical protein
VLCNNTISGTPTHTSLSCAHQTQCAACAASNQHKQYKHKPVHEALKLNNHACTVAGAANICCNGAPVLKTWTPTP